jgi:membrane protein required for colicin V production
MNFLDWILLAVIALTAIRASVRGFVKELFSVAAPVAGLGAALALYKPAGAFLKGRFGLEFIPEAVAFAAILVLGIVIVRIIASMLREGLEAANMEGVDRILGFCFGALEGLVVVAFLVLLLALQPFADASGLLAGSFFARFLLPIVGPGVEKALAPAIQAGKDAIPTIRPSGK